MLNGQLLSMPGPQQVAVEHERSTCVDASGRPVPANLVPPFLMRSITPDEAADKLVRSPLAMQIGVPMMVHRAQSIDRRLALSDRDTGMPIFVAEQQTMHWSSPAAGDVWPEMLHRIHLYIGGKLGLECMSLFIELSRVLTKPLVFVVADGMAVQTMQPCRTDSRTMMLVQRPPGLTRFLTAGQLNALAATTRDQTRSRRIAVLYEAGAILDAEPKLHPGTHATRRRFQLDPLPFRARNHPSVREAVHETLHFLHQRDRLHAVIPDDGSIAAGARGSYRREARG